MKILLSLCMVIIVFEVYAQDQSSFKQDANLNIISNAKGSPNSVALGMYGNINVNGYNGKTNVSFPLHTFNLCGKEFPISLNYNMAGLKPIEESSWIGLGWSLSGHPVITRSIKDMDDFYIHDDQYSTKYGWLYTTTLDVQSSCNQATWNLNQPTENFYDNYYISTDKMKYDLEPDEFSVNLFGENIKFYLGKHTPPNDLVDCVVVTDKNYAVTISESTKNIIISAPDGFKYYFDQKELTNNYSFSAHFLNQITTWYIKTIVSPSGEIISFGYTQNGKTKSLIFKNQIQNLQYYQYSYPGGSTVLGTGIIDWDSWFENDEIILNGISSGAERLSFITSNRTDIQGHNGYVPQKLSKIIVQYKFPDINGAPIETYIDKKEITFNQTYFRENDNYEYKRLKLNSIKIFDKQFYFDYNNSHLLPKKTTYNIDMWGYFNSANNCNSNNCHLNPKVIYNGNQMFSNGANREADPAFSIAGQLESITYPTGGKTEFVFEGNEVKLDDNYNPGWEHNQNLSPGGPFRNKTVGGLRIHQIIDKDVNGQVISLRELLYNEPNSLVSSGLLMDENPLYVTDSKMKGFDVWEPGNTGKAFFEIKYITTQGSHIPILENTANGSHIGYSYVTTKFIDNKDPNNLIEYYVKKEFSNNQNVRSGYLVNVRYNSNYSYYNANAWTAPPMYPPGTAFRGYLTTDYIGTAYPVIQSFEQSNGSVLKEEWYDANNSLVKEVNYIYSTLIDNQIVVDGVRHTIGNCSSINNSHTGGTVLDSYVNYCRKQTKSVLTNVSTTEYTDNGSLVSAIDYIYTNNWKLREMRSTLSNGDLKSYFIYYADDYSNSINSINYLSTNHQLSVPVKTESVINSNLVAGIINEFNTDGNVFKTYQYENNSLSSPIPHSTTPLINNSNYKLQATFGYHDLNQAYGLAQPSCKLKDITDEHGMPITLIWGYNQAYIVAKIYGLTHGDVLNIFSVDQNLLNNTASESARTIELNNLRTAVENAGYFIETFRYDPIIGPIEQVNNQKIKAGYQYYSDGKLKGILNTDGKMIKAYEYGFFHGQ